MANSKEAEVHRIFCGHHGVAHGPTEVLHARAQVSLGTEDIHEVNVAFVGLVQFKFLEEEVDLKKNANIATSDVSFVAEDRW